MASILIKNKKKFLITGGAGFIGSNFVDYLYQREDNIEVRVLDKLSYSSNFKSLNNYIDRKDFEFIEGDICDPMIVKKAMQDIHVVINFAAEVAVDRSIEKPQAFLQTDIVGVYTLLEEAKQQRNLQKFIQISTDEVYGQILKGSFLETSELKPRNPYAASKLGGDRLAYSFFATHGVPVVITRGSNTFGPKAYTEKIIPLFITNLIEEEKVPLYGEGKQIRDWLYVEDHCSAIYLLLTKGVDGEVYNIGGNQEYNNLELTRRILALMEKDESNIRFVQDRPSHDFRYSLNCAKLRSLGWTPQFDLQEGLKKTIDWYKNNEDWWQPVRNKMEKRYITGFWGG